MIGYEKGILEIQSLEKCLRFDLHALDLWWTSLPVVPIHCATENVKLKL